MSLASYCSPNYVTKGRILKFCKCDIYFTYLQFWENFILLHTAVLGINVTLMPSLTI